MNTSKHGRPFLKVFKKVLKNGATGVFQGKILVKPGAQKTDGYQISQSLLSLSGGLLTTSAIIPPTITRAVRLLPSIDGSNFK